MSKLISKRLFTKATGKYSAAISMTYDEAKEAWKAVDEALKIARKKKRDQTLPRTQVLVEARKVQILSQAKKGLQEGLEQLRKAEQARIEGRWRKSQEQGTDVEVKDE